MKIPMPLKLIGGRAVGKGYEINAVPNMPKGSAELNFVEFSIKGDCPQLILTDHWIQFPTKEWEEWIDAIGAKIVELYNEQAGK